VENVLSAVVDLTQVELAKRDVAIAWQPSGRPQRMIMRPDQLQQVFLNLLLNAAEAMPAGGTVTLRLDRDEMPRGEGGSAPAVRVDVQDGGEGMPPEVQRQLFEPFFTTKPEGSGLGLYICHRIIREHGGEIEVHSREGEGTTVSTWLPAPAPE
jgi:signal transduction histidine kinase